MPSIKKTVGTNILKDLTLLGIPSIGTESKNYIILYNTKVNQSHP